MKKCPFCGADIEDSARFCLYCMEPLTEKEQILPQQKKKPQWLIIIAAIAALVILTILLLPAVLEKPTLSSAPSESAESPTPSQTEPTASSHIHSYFLPNPTNQYLKEKATCLAPAVYYYSCLCGAAGTETFPYGEPAEHTVVTNPGYPATCETPGLTDYTYCAVCQLVFSMHSEIQDLGHTFKPSDSLSNCLACGKLGAVIVSAPEFPFAPNDTYRINSCTYTIRRSSDGETWELSISINITNISSETQPVSPVATVYFYTDGNLSGHPCFYRSVTLQPNESQTLTIQAWVPSRHMYELVFR